MIIGVPKECWRGETRVSLAPAHVASLTELGFEVVVERSAGSASGFDDEAYRERTVSIVENRAQVLTQCDVLLTVRGAAADPETALGDLATMREGQTIIGLLEPYQPHEIFNRYVERRISSFSMELIPRITRAQSMDALSSMANLSGYRAALLAATALPKMFPLMMTAAGTIVPAKVFVIGAGVAGLQAIATTQRLGAMVSAYDLRPAVKEQVESLGARFVELALESEDSEGSGGYAQEMDAHFYRRQQELMSTMVKQSDVVICTAAVPGRRSPVLLNEEMVQRMHTGAVIVDLAADRGGNCALTKAGETVQVGGVTIIGAINLPATMPHDASRLYSKNVTTLLQWLKREDGLCFDMEDEIVGATLVTHDGRIPNEETGGRLGFKEN